MSGAADTTDPERELRESIAKEVRRLAVVYARKYSASVRGVDGSAEEQAAHDALVADAASVAAVAANAVARERAVEAFRALVFAGIKRSLELDGHCKAYEGKIDIAYPSYFAGQGSGLLYSPRDQYEVRLACYVLGPGRGYCWKGDTLDEALAKATADVERWIANLDADEDAPEPEPRAFVGYFDDVNDAQDALARERAAREAVERERDALRARLKCKHRQCSRELDDRCGGYCLPCAENLDLRPPEGGCASCERKATP